MRAVITFLATLGLASVCVAQTDVVRLYPSEVQDVNLNMQLPPTDPGYLQNEGGSGVTMGPNGSYPWAIRRTLLKFDLASLPEGTVLQEATLALRNVSPFSGTGYPVQLVERMSFDAWTATSIDPAGYIASTNTVLGGQTDIQDNTQFTPWVLAPAAWDCAADLQDDTVSLQLRFAAEGDYYWKAASYFNGYAGLASDKWPYLELDVQLGPATWTELGFAKNCPTHGLPHLAGSGPLSTGMAAQLDMSGARPSSLAWLIVGASALNSPFRGGVLVPQPLLPLVLATNASGALSLPFVGPAGLPAGLSLYFQYWVQDADAVPGFSASNGLKGVTS